MRLSSICFAACFLSLFATRSQAQPEYKLSIKEATVFLSGADLVSSADVTLAQGENEVLFNNVAGDINTKSITVSAGNGVVVESVTFQNNYLAHETFPPQVKELKDSIDTVTAKKEEISNKLTVIDEEVAILQANRKVSGDHSGLAVGELSKMLDLANTRLTDLLTQKSKQRELLKKTDELLAKLNSQVDELQKKANHPEGVLRVKFYAKEATKTMIVTTYMVSSAGWSPTYDIYADNINSPVKLYYKANIHQNCGVNWENIHLSLSTGNPVEGVDAPVLNPWYLSIYYPPPPPQSQPVAPETKDEDGVVDENKSEVTAMTSTGSAAYAAAPSLGYTVPLVVTSGINNYVSVDNSGVSTTFDIDLPYSIPNDGQEHLVAVKQTELPATYRYFVIPKVDKDAFLQAEITKWEDLNLLPGTTNIFYENTYVGQGFLDVRNLKDTFDISLGRDKKIVVKREADKTRRSVRTIGSNVREAFAYTTSIRNTRKESINLIMEDQQPVSNDKDIVIEDVETGDSDFDKTTGKMTWTLSVAPNETKKISFGYTVKYPKGKTVLNLK